MTKFLYFLKKQPILVGVLAVVVAVLGLSGIKQDSYGSRCILRFLMCGTMLFFLWLISGEKTLSQGSQQTGYVIKKGLIIWIIAFLSGLPPLLASLKAEIPAGWLLRLVLLFFMFLFACLFEELCFRSVLNDAIVYQFRNSRHVFVWSAIITSLAFGFIHCLGSPLTNPIEWAQAALKTLECAFFGFMLLVLYWKTRNIWACGLLHAGFDFLNGLSLIGQENAKIGVGTYVSAAGNAITYVILYVVIDLICALIAWRIWRKVGRTIDFEEMRKSW